MADHNQSQDFSQTQSRFNHSFEISFATEFKSVEIAILIWHFQFWIGINKRMYRHFHKDRTWTYQSLQEISAIFPYWSLDQVNRLLQKMVNLKILVKGNFNKSKFDRTVWYAFVDEAKFGLRTECNFHFAKSPNGDGEIAKPIPDTLPDTLPDKRGGEGGKPPPRTPKLEKHPIRENVFLTDAELHKLKELYGLKKLEWMLDCLSAKKGAKGYKYESDYHVLLPANWVNEEYDKHSPEAKKVIPSPNPVPEQEDDEEKNRNWWKQLEIKERIFNDLFLHSTYDYVEIGFLDGEGKNSKFYFKKPGFKEKVEQDIERRRRKGRRCG